MHFPDLSKVVGLVLLALAPLAASSQAQSTAPADWRSIATPADRNRLERWEELFELAQEWVRKLPLKDEYGNARAPFESITLGYPVHEIPSSWHGLRRCRSIDASSRRSMADPWFRCRLLAVAGQWRIEKISGSIFLSMNFYLDDTFGMVGLGSAWSDRSLRPAYGGGTPSATDKAGILRFDGANVLRVFAPHDSYFQVYEIDLAR